MGGLLGGGGMGNSSGGQGGGFLSNLLGGLPDPLGLGKLLGITGQQDQGQGGGPPPAAGVAPPPQGATFAPQRAPSGVSYDPSQAGFSPLGPTGFGVGGKR